MRGHELVSFYFIVRTRMCLQVFIMVSVFRLQGDLSYVILANSIGICSVRMLGLLRSQPICICPFGSPENESLNDRTQDRCLGVKF